MKKRVMCFGTFDILHPGHLKFFEAAKMLGEELFVVISRDERREQITGKRPVHTQKERMAVIEALKPVKRAVAGKKKDILAVIKEIKPQIIALGHDQVYGIEVLERWCASQKRPPKIVRLPAFNRKRHSTSRIRNHLMGKF